MANYPCFSSYNRDDIYVCFLRIIHGSSTLTEVVKLAIKVATRIRFIRHDIHCRYSLGEVGACNDPNFIFSLFPFHTKSFPFSHKSPSKLHQTTLQTIKRARLTHRRVFLVFTDRETSRPRMRGQFWLWFTDAGSFCAILGYLRRCHSPGTRPPPLGAHI